jgi:hypothetical protein
VSGCRGRGFRGAPFFEGDALLKEVFMARKKAENPLSGKTLQWMFEEGSMAGTTFEHHFYADGTVAYRTVDDSKEKGAAGKGDEDRPKYKAFEMSDNVVVASYLGEQGYALTVALNFDDGRVVGFASNDKEWFPCEGTFEEATEGQKKAVVTDATGTTGTGGGSTIAAACASSTSTWTRCGQITYPGTAIRGQRRRTWTGW